MIDLQHLEQYRENNRIEAKKAVGGLPQSIWETYSAFANTLGGIILLGVEEHPDKSLHAVHLPDPEKLVKDFWDAVNNPNKASVNILSSKDVTIEPAGEESIVVINVPRADRTYKPVYVDGNPLNSYRRNGEGDYKCTADELHAMYRDASIKTQDMLVLQKMTLDVITPRACVLIGSGCVSASPGMSGILWTTSIFSSNSAQRQSAKTVRFIPPQQAY